MKTRSTTFDLPIWFAAARANDDFTALSEEEIAEFNAISVEISHQVGTVRWSIDYNHEDHPSPGYPELGDSRRLLQDVQEVKIDYPI